MEFTAMKVSELMTTEVRACNPHDTLNRAAQLMWENDCGAIPVVDSGGKVIGMLTDRDVCMAAYTRGVPLAHARVENAMSPDVSTCIATDTIAIAAERMRQRQVRRLPVIDDDGVLIGILSLSDIVREADSNRASKSRKRPIKDSELIETLGAISVAVRHARGVNGHRAASHDSASH
jgi:CBS-domain-containing membrane protein